MKPVRVRPGHPDYSPHYVNGNKAAPQEFEIRLSDGRVVGNRRASIAELECIAADNDVVWAECEAVSGFYSHCIGRRAESSSPTP